MLLHAACLLLLGAAALASELNSVEGVGERRLVCYYSNWAVYRPGLSRFAPENIDPSLCTHMVYAFAALGDDFSLQPFDPYNDIEQGNYARFVSGARGGGARALLAVGGWNEGSRRFSRLVEEAGRRAAFVRSALAFLRLHGFDGLDLDWEYPGFREGGNRTHDKTGYATLLKELREAFEEEQVPKGKERLLLSVAVPATKDYIDQGFDVPVIAKYADFLNVLSYDYHSAYEPQTHHHAPLYPPEGSTDQLNVAWTVDYYLSLGAPANKLVVGIPLYGRSYTLAEGATGEAEGAPAEGPGLEGPATREKGYLAFYEICQKVKEEGWEVEPSGPFAWKGDQWVSFDDEDSALRKAQFVRERGLGGAMVWTLDNDDFRGLCTGQPSPIVATLKAALLGVVESSPSERTVARAAGTEGAEVRFDDDERAPRRRNTLRRLVQDRQAGRTSKRPEATTSEAPPSEGAFECSDEGFFSHPRDCRRYFWCLDSGPANLGVVAHAFTCPSGLHFNSGSESCDYPENVVCPGGKKTTRSTTTTTTSTTTTTTEPPPDTTPATTEPSTAAPEEGEHSVAELLRLLQAIGGVERLQSLLGAQEQASTTISSTRTPRNRATPEPLDSPRRTPLYKPADLFLDPYDLGAVEPALADELPTDDFGFANKPQQVTAIKPQQQSSSSRVEYAEEEGEETTPYRTPIRVQVGRVVRVQNGTTPLQGGVLEGGRRRMLVRVRPANRTEEPPIGRAVGDRTLSGSTLQATRAEPRVAVRRRPANPRRPLVEEQVTTTTTPVPTTTTPAPTDPPTTTVAPSTEYDEDEYEYYDEYEDEEEEGEKSTTTTTTTTTTTKRPLKRFTTTRAPTTITTTTSKPSRRATSRISATNSPRTSATSSSPRTSATSSPRTTPSAEATPQEGVIIRSDTDVECFKRGVFIHPSECSRFVVCAPASRSSGHALKGRVLHCPANQVYLADVGRCMKGDRTKCSKK